MRNEYKLVRTWRYLMIGSTLSLFIIFLLPIFFGNYSGNPSNFIWGAIIAGGFSGALTIFVITSKVITSPLGIESVYFGAQIRLTWEQIERIDINPFGVVNLLTKESIYKNNLVNALLRPIAGDRIFSLSPFIDDLATSNLLKDITRYVPTLKIPEFVLTKQRSTLPYQKVGWIGLYYLCWLLTSTLLAYLVRRGAMGLEATGLANMTLVSYLVTTSLLMGLLLNGLALLAYNAEIADLHESEIAHRAKAHYLSPFLVILMSILVGFCIWAIMQARSIILLEEDYGIFAMVAFLIGGISMRLSNRVERLLFKDK